MSVYNAGDFLHESISSIINQSFLDFEFVIVNDGSNDESQKIIKSYNDSRIKLINNKTNVGLTKSLNIGLSKCRGKYIARMDADDFSMPSRLKIQCDYLKSNPSIDIIGTNAYKIINNKRIRTTLPLEDKRIKWQLLFSAPIIHPSVMVRANVFKKFGNFNSKLIAAQDFEYWCRVSEHVQFANLPDVLHNIRIHSKSISSVKNKEQENSRLETLVMYIRSITKNRYELDELNIFYLMRSKKFLTNKQLSIAINILNELRKEFFKKNQEDISYKNFVNEKISWLILQPVFSNNVNFHLFPQCLLAAFRFNHSIIREKIFFNYMKLAFSKAIKKKYNAYMFRR